MKREQVFIDTGAWIALLIANDQYHDKAVDFYSNLSSAIRRTTSSHVVSETYTWLRYKAGYRYASRYLEVISQSQLQSRLTILYDNAEILELADAILRDFPDQKLSYTDAISMSMMRLENIRKVFGFDRHFYLMGFEMVPQS